MNFAMESVERRVVDNRTFMIGLDELYRKSMQRFEATRLLECARAVARALGAAPDAGPVEGYYAESPALTEYFQLMRALQRRDHSDAPRVERLEEFSLLHAITTSGLYGRAEGDRLLPRCVDVLGLALEQEAQNGWSKSVLAERARSIAIETGDFSLVALAARTGDLVVLAAARESVALYADLMSLGSEGRIAYAWQVDDELSAAANRLHPDPESVRRFPAPAGDSGIGGEVLRRGQQGPTGRTVRCDRLRSRVAAILSLGHCRTVLRRLPCRGVLGTGAVDDQPVPVAADHQGRVVGCCSSH